MTKIDLFLVFFAAMVAMHILKRLEYRYMQWQSERQWKKRHPEGTEEYLPTIRIPVNPEVHDVVRDII
jgi:hypothetical protein